jgi:hypothetical protein
VVIFDEGHNIDSVCESASSFELDTHQLAFAVSEVEDAYEMAGSDECAHVLEHAKLNKEEMQQLLAFLKQRLTELAKAIDVVKLKGASSVEPTTSSSEATRKDSSEKTASSTEPGEKQEESKKGGSAEASAEEKRPPPPPPVVSSKPWKTAAPPRVVVTSKTVEPAKPNNQFTQANNQFTKANNQFTQANNQFTKVNDRFTKANNQFAAANSTQFADVGIPPEIIASAPTPFQVIEDKRNRRTCGIEGCGDGGSSSEGGHN